MMRTAMILWAACALTMASAADDSSSRSPITPQVVDGSPPAGVIANPVQHAAWQRTQTHPALARKVDSALVTRTRNGSARLADAPMRPEAAPLYADRALHGARADAPAYAFAAVVVTRDAQWAEPLVAHPDPAIRRAALGALHRHPEPWAQTLLAGAFLDIDIGVREVAVSTLGRHPRAQERLDDFRSAVLDPSPTVRSMAVRALGVWGGEAERAVVFARITDRDAAVRLQALRALGRLDPSAATDAARRLASDPDQRVQRAARQMLAN